VLLYSFCLEKQILRNLFLFQRESKTLFRRDSVGAFIIGKNYQKGDLKMTTSDETQKRPLWLLIEENILELDSQDLSGENLEASIQRIAGELDNAGYNVSHHGGKILQ